MSKLEVPPTKSTGVFPHQDSVRETESGRDCDFLQVTEPIRALVWAGATQRHPGLALLCEILLPVDTGKGLT